MSDDRRRRFYRISRRHIHSSESLSRQATPSNVFHRLLSTLVRAVVCHIQLTTQKQQQRHRLSVAGGIRRPSIRTTTCCISTDTRDVPPPSKTFLHFLPPPVRRIFENIKKTGLSTTSWDPDSLYPKPCVPVFLRH